VLAQVPVVEVLSIPGKYFRQFPKKEWPQKSRAPIKEGVKAEDILERMLEEEMKVMPKELWAVAPKLRIALKEILTSKRTAKEDASQTLEPKEKSTIQKIVLVNSLESPERRQEIMEVEDGEVVEVWTVADPVLQFLEKLPLEERECQIFSIEEEKIVTKKIGSRHGTTKGSTSCSKWSWRRRGFIG